MAGQWTRPPPCVKIVRVGLFATLRTKWRRHDEKLAEHAYRDRDIIEGLDEHEHVMNAGLLGSSAAGSLFSAQGAETEVERAVQSEDALEHEEPK